MCDLRKDVREIIDVNFPFFEKLNTIQEVHIYGFSFSQIDMPYIDKILSKVDVQTSKWEISFFTEQDKEKIGHFIDTAKTPKNHARLVRLTDIHLDPQLKISFE